MATRDAEYVLLDQLGEGGFGAAFRALQRSGPKGPKREATVCVKLTAHRDAWHRECYFGELLRGNKRAVQVIDDFVLGNPAAPDGYVYALVTELMDNGSLDAYMREQPEPWPEERIRREVRGVLSALDQLHKGRAMHRDLTPMNVLVSGSGHLKLGDFGISRHAAGRADLDADAFNSFFAPTAIAVEDSTRWGAVDDVWQVGQLIAMLVRAIPEPITTKAVKTLACSDELKSITRRCIGDKALRYEDAFALAEALGGTPSSPRSRLQSLEGKTVVFTGTLWTHRVNAADLVREVGGAVSDTVSRNTDVLVCGRASHNYVAQSKGMKRIKAETLRANGQRISIITEAQFRRLVTG